MMKPRKYCLDGGRKNKQKYETKEERRNRKHFYLKFDLSLIEYSDVVRLKYFAKSFLYLPFPFDLFICEYRRLELNEEIANVVAIVWNVARSCRNSEMANALSIHRCLTLHIYYQLKDEYKFLFVVFSPIQFRLTFSVLFTQCKQLRLAVNEKECVRVCNWIDLYFILFVLGFSSLLFAILSSCNSILFGDDEKTNGCASFCGTFCVTKWKRTRKRFRDSERKAKYSFCIAIILLELFYFFGLMRRESLFNSSTWSFNCLSLLKFRSRRCALFSRCPHQSFSLATEWKIKMHQSEFKEIT